MTNAHRITVAEELRTSTDMTSIRLAATPAGLAKNISEFRSGNAAVAAGTARYYNDTADSWTIQSVRVSAATAPTGATLIVDCDVNGTTVFTNQAHRPAVAISGNTVKVTTIDLPTVAPGAYISFDIDQIGSSVTGANVTIMAVVTPA